MNIKVDNLLLKYGRKFCVMLSLPILFSCSMTQPRTLTAERLQPLEVQTLAEARGAVKDSLRLVSLNLAHGRHDSFHQLFLSANTLRQNIDETALYIKTLDADLVALQEADGPSWWSGSFDHVDRLAKQAGFYNYVRAENVNNFMGDYGSAVLSQLPITEGFGFVFQPSPPTSNKGFSLAQVHWLTPGASEPHIIDVVSVHLDFSRDSVRQEQIDEMKAMLAPRALGGRDSLIIMGDFNSEWLAHEYMVERFAEKSALHVFEADSDQYNTYGSKRLDWVLMSKNLEFVRYRVDDAKLSDHHVVITDIKIKN